MKTAKYFSDGIIWLLALCVAMSFLLQIFNVTRIANAVYAGTLLIVLGCYFLSGHIDRVTGLIVALLCISSFIRGFKSNTDYFLHILITICVVLCIDVSCAVKVSKETYKKISKLFVFIAIVLLLGYYFGPLKYSYFERTSAIALNFHNPNAAGLWLSCIFILLSYSASIYTRGKRFLYVCVSVGILPIIIATKSRNSLLACVVFVVAIVFVRITGIKKLPKWLLAVISCLPILVFFFYTFVVLNTMEFWQNVFLTSIDKSIDSRAGVWTRVLENFWNNFIIGNYIKYYDSQQHNSLITLYCRYGALTTLLFCRLAFRSLNNLQENSSIYATLSLSAILLTGCFEASFAVGVAGLYLMLLLIPACASVETIPEEKPRRRYIY